MYALEASTGDLLWSYYQGNNSDGGVAEANGVVYFTANSGATTALNERTGAELWSYQSELPLQPAVVDGVLYIGDQISSTMYAFGLK
jgi:outer membrane protein assembly factor BamB